MKLYKIIIGIVLFVAFLFGISRLPLADYLNHLTVWFRGFGIWGPVVFYIFFTIFSSWLFPVFMLGICAGILFEPWQALLVITIGNLTSYWIMYVLARYGFRERFARKFTSHQRIKDLLKVISIEGWFMVMMLRIVPMVHTVILNITCGISGMRTREYLLGSFLGMMPWLFIYVYIGTLTDSVISSSSEIGFSRNQNIVSMAVAIVVLIVFTVYMRKVTKRHMSADLGRDV